MDSNKKVARDASFFPKVRRFFTGLKRMGRCTGTMPLRRSVSILNYVMFQAELIHRWISVWGLVGGALILAMGFLRMFDYPVVYLAIPIVLNELILSVWLIVKGLNSSAISSKTVIHTVN